MLKNKFFSHTRGSAGVILIILSLIFGSAVLIQKSQVRHRATPGVPTLYFAREAQTPRSDQNFDLVLKVNPNGAAFYAFELYATFDPTKVDFQDNVNLSQNITSAYPLIRSSIEINNKRITIIGTRIDGPFKGSEEAEIGRVKMKRKPSASGDLVFSWAGDTKLGNKLATEKLNGKFNY